MGLGGVVEIDAFPEGAVSVMGVWVVEVAETTSYKQAGIPDVEVICAAVVQK